MSPGLRAKRDERRGKAEAVVEEEHEEHDDEGKASTTSKHYERRT
jgi:hypothetical protein